MIHRSDPDISKRLSLFTSSAVIFSVVVGWSVLAGWTLDIPALLTWGAGTRACQLRIAVAQLLGRVGERLGVRFRQRRGFAVARIVLRPVGGPLGVFLLDLRGRRCRH